MKKMISRRNFLKAAALAGSAMALTACGGKGSAGDKAAAAVVVDGPVEFPLAETVTLTGTTSYPAGSESEPNNRTIFKRLEESTNVHIEWTAIQSDQWGDKISLNMSNPNTLTDFVFTADFSDSNLLRYAKQGVVIALEEYIDTCMPNLQAVFEKYPSTAPCAPTPRATSGPCPGSSSWVWTRPRSRPSAICLSSTPSGSTSWALRCPTPLTSSSRC